MVVAGKTDRQGSSTRVPLTAKPSWDLATVHRGVRRVCRYLEDALLRTQNALHLYTQPIGASDPPSRSASWECQLPISTWQVLSILRHNTSRDYNEHHIYQASLSLPPTAPLLHPLDFTLSDATPYSTTASRGRRSPNSTTCHHHRCPTTRVGYFGSRHYRAYESFRGENSSGNDPSL